MEAINQLFAMHHAAHEEFVNTVNRQTAEMQAYCAAAREQRAADYVEEIESSNTNDKHTPDVWFEQESRRMSESYAARVQEMREQHERAIQYMLNNF